MKRKTIRYEVFSTFPILSWKVCHFCNYEFIRERLWFSVTSGRVIYSCKECSPSEESFCENYDNWISNIKPPKAPKAPPAPPRRPSGRLIKDEREIRECTND